MSLFRRPVEKRDLDFPWGDDDKLVNPSSMTVERALSLAPVFAAGRILASAVASLPLQTYRKNGDQREQIPAPTLFTGSAGDGLNTAAGTQSDWLFRAMTSLVYRGNAVGLITSRDYAQYPRDIVWLSPDRIQVQDSMRSGRGSFQDPIWFLDGKPIPAHDLVHIPWFTLPGKVLGLSPLSAYASSVSTAFAAEGYSNDWFTNGGVPPGKFRNTEKVVDQHQAKVMKDRMTEAIRSHKPLVYGADWEYDTISVPSNEVNFVETMRLTATQIASIYGIPAEMIGGNKADSLTYSNVEQNSLEFVQFTLRPWVTKLESHFSALLPRGQYVKFNVDAMIRTDATTRMNNYAIARNIGLNSLNELRAKEDLPPIPRGDSYTPLELELVQAGKAVSATRSAPEQMTSADMALELEELNRAGTGGSTLPIGPGHALWEYWTKGEGFAKWASAEHKWTKLHRLLLEAGVPAHSAKGLTTNIIQATMPGYLQTNH